MRTILPVLTALIFISPAAAQPLLDKAATDAHLISRMAEKFHLQPRPLDSSFSTATFNRVLDELDKDRILFTRNELELLLPFRRQLHRSVAEKNPGYLRLLAQLYELSLVRADSLAGLAQKAPPDFNTPETFTVAEQENFADHPNALARKFKKHLGARVMAAVLDQKDGAPLRLDKKQLDSLSLHYRSKMLAAYRRGIRKKLESPGGVPGLVGQLYCDMIASWYDPHTNYFPLTVKENFESSLGQKSMMFGFALDEAEDNGVLISSLKPGSPAYQCGQLNEGDRIQSIQWQGKAPIDVSGASVAELASILEASNHDKARIVVTKKDGTSREVELAKASIEDEEEEDRVKSFLLRGSRTIGYISLPAFYEDWSGTENNLNGCANDVAREVLKLKKENIEALILDLRYNGGGSVQEAVELAGIFIDAGPVAMGKDRNPKIYTLKDAIRGTIYDGPLVVMVNGYSASASELVAATLQDYNRALVVGSTTYGKATGQVILPLDTTINLQADFSRKQAGSYVKMTVSNLYRVNGSTAQFTGVVPDVQLPDLMEADPQREANEPFALVPGTVPPNKYYTALPALDKTGLQEHARKFTDTAAFFKALGSYVSARKAAALKQDIALNWPAALQAARKHHSRLPSFSLQQGGLFKASSHQYDQQRLAARDLLAANENWKSFIEKDPYLQVTYLLTLELISKSLKN